MCVVSIIVIVTIIIVFAIIIIIIIIIIINTKQQGSSKGVWMFGNWKWNLRTHMRTRHPYHFGIIP